ncbi:MAG: L,D-transpeptidase family protein [gamma proteobacterium endosymbiont of Lamellibrachia anaximandri]|nr:L,D-transpeptidase family protein [gamma proteobacterium endosymbiont of Lamellibrachia anaximandri]MBL3534507.1 L,D-transpeptidase family protein [gamma proteobacterium endosymbiont of Lamellibrachia anaximandri]MBL3600380.1 L,D-transpeptidase family protein [gamma proteobacterium endosymbiont of Lamellibrachia anaximandri]
MTRFLLLLTALLPYPGLVFSLTLPLPENGDDIVGEVIELEARYEDTLSDIARKYDLGFRQIRIANPKVDPWLPKEGSQILVPQQYILPPGPRSGVVINLAEMRLYYYPEARNEVMTFPLGIGREGWNTPTGDTHIIRKKKDPAWVVPESILQEHEEKGDPLPPVVPPGPDNPLGGYALYLGMPGYLLHGTNKPYGVGLRVSHGCIRLYPEDISSFFSEVPKDTPVRIINQPYKAGWLNGKLFLQVYPPLSEELGEKGQNFTGLVAAMLNKLGQDSRKPDWNTLQEIGGQQNGIPEELTLWE